MDTSDTYGVRAARAAETTARLRAERLEREAAAAVVDWNRAKGERVRAESWSHADTLRRELAETEARAARVTLENPTGENLTRDGWLGRVEDAKSL